MPKRKHDTIDGVPHAWCCRCKTFQPFSMFSKSKGMADGMTSKCKPCAKEYHNIWMQTKTEEKKARNKKKCKAWSRKHAQRKKDSNNAYYAENRERIREKQKIYNALPIPTQRRRERYERLKRLGRTYTRNPEKCRAWSRAYYKRHRDRIMTSRRQYNKRPDVKRKRNMRDRKRRKIDPAFQLMDCIRRRINKALEKRGGKGGVHTIELLGCTADEFWNYMQTTMTPDMRGHAFGKGQLTIDHRRPLASFDMGDPEQRRMAFHYTNCQAMLASDNMSKGCAYDRETFGYVWKAHLGCWMRKFRIC